LALQTGTPTIDRIATHEEKPSMTTQALAAALQRVEAVLKRRPEAGLHDDAPALACWQGGTRIVSSHANGTQVDTDMPAEFGGSGDRVTPGWLFRAGLASCAATSVAMAAASAGIVLTRLEARVGSRSDARGMLGMADAEGEPVFPGPREVRLQVRIAARDVATQRLRALVEQGLRCSPIPSVVQAGMPLELQIDVDVDAGAAA
jgi:uncharacterized OsmC-like protein